MPGSTPRALARLPLLVLVAALLAVPGRALGLPEPVARKLDPSLVAWLESGGGRRALWVTFASRGEDDPARFAARLAAAEASLTPRARARRLRAGVRPLVDVRDLPVETADLEALRDLGLEPFAVSRWLNRAAVRTGPERIAALAALERVGRISPVALAPPPAPEPAGPAIVLPPAHDAGRAGAGPPRLLGGAAGLAEGQLAQIGATTLHAAGFNGAGVLVVMIDEGFNFTWKHEALRDRVFPPGFLRDFVEGDTVPSDTTQLASFGHGTQTLACLAGDRPGVYQGSGYGATVALARTEDHSSETGAEMLYWAQAAEWADSLGADLISSSVGYDLFESGPVYGPEDFDGRTTDISRAAEIAASKGILVVNSVGNRGALSFPRLAAPSDVHGDSLIAVGAVDTFGNVAPFSSRGPTSDGRVKPDLVARGAGAWVVDGGGQPNTYLQRDGTSFAAPLVAGLAASLMQARPELAPRDVIRALRETASAMCFPDMSGGWGIPDGGAALAWAPPPAGFEQPPGGYLDLQAVSPNPLRRGDRVQLRFGLGPRLAETADARLRVFDSQGRIVQRLFYGSLTCGRWQSVDWNGLDPHGRAARPGIYFVHFDAEGRTRTLRVVLLD